MSDTNVTIRDRIKSANEWLVGAGVVMLFFSFLCMLLEVQTSEAAITHGGGVHALVAPNVSTVMQLYYMLMGQLSPRDTVIAIWGWGSQITFFACIVGYNHFHKAVARHNKGLAAICCGVAALITLYNCVSDYNYVGMVIQDFWWQLAISSVIALATAALGIAGLYFIKIGFSKEG